ncbi:hypothetical protein AgCh_019032 [Apium graveolens]
MYGCCIGNFVLKRKSLTVTSPDNLRETYESAIGSFGVPEFEGTLVGTVIYPEANQKACKSFDNMISFKSKSARDLPVFLLADRGDCYLSLKAWNAQNAGAAAILVAEDSFEPLTFMASPQEVGPDGHADYLKNITVPSALISRSLGNSIKKALSNGDTVTINLDWKEALPHPDERVKYELWTTSSDECGPNCESQIKFMIMFKGMAQILEWKGYTKFTPHYMTWNCPEAFVLSTRCKSQCINHGRYCAPDPDQDFYKGYEGKDVIVQNLLQACVYKVANESGRPWLWWDYVAEFRICCRMRDNKYTKDCANKIMQSHGMDVKRIDQCIGDPTADMDNPILEAELAAQNGTGSGGNITSLPTLVINNRQYTGKLERGEVLRAICSNFNETTKPDVCINGMIIKRLPVPVKPSGSRGHGTNRLPAEKLPYAGISANDEFTNKV